jgi:hypothetical protein
VAGRSSSPECLPSRATEVSFQQGLFLRDRSGVGISPGRVSTSGGEQKMACDDKTLALILDDDGRDLQGAESTGSSSNGCSMASASLLCSHHGPKHC